MKKLIFATLIAASSFAMAANDYEEVSYDDLVNQLNQRKSQYSTSSYNSTFDELKIHAGFGLASSANNIKIREKDVTKYHNGFQISLGIDLFSRNFAAEGVIRNFGTTGSGTETRSLREFDMKFLYRGFANPQAGFRIGAGLGNRYFKMTDDAANISINDTTPVGIMFGGADAYVSKNFSVGVEIAARSALSDKTSDKNSVDATFRMDSYF